MVSIRILQAGLMQTRTRRGSREISLLELWKDGIFETAIFIQLPRDFHQVKHCHTITSGQKVKLVRRAS